MENYLVRGLGILLGDVIQVQVDKEEFKKYINEVEND